MKYFIRAEKFNAIVSSRNVNAIEFLMCQASDRCLKQKGNRVIIGNYATHL